MKGKHVSGPVFKSTYYKEGTAARWLRGNHHGHSNQSDGEDEPLTILHSYEEAGYDYLALSEHDCLLSRSYLQSHTSMCILPAVEVTSRFWQSLHFLGADGSLPKNMLTPTETYMTWGVILEPLRVIMDNLGLSEIDQVESFLVLK